MAAFVRELDSGDVLVFDKAKREMYIVKQRAAKQHKKLDVKTAKALVDEGSAQFFSSDDLETLTQAMAAVVLLAVSG